MMARRLPRRDAKGRFVKGAKRVASTLRRVRVHRRRRRR